jgi:hypothetical protein
MVVTGLFLLLFTVTMGVLMFRLLYLPVNMVPQVQKAKYEIVATLWLLDIFAPGYLLWITALLTSAASSATSCGVMCGNRCDTLDGTAEEIHAFLCECGVIELIL